VFASAWENHDDDGSEADHPLWTARMLAPERVRPARGRMLRRAETAGMMRARPQVRGWTGWMVST